MLVPASKFSGPDFLNEAFKTSGKCLELLPPGLDLEVGSTRAACSGGTMEGTADGPL